MQTVIHSALQEAVRLELIQRNVADLVRIPTRQHGRKVTFTEDQILVFLSAIKGNRLEALYILALTTGMREGEILGLQWGDIDFHGSMLSVTHPSFVRSGTRAGTSCGFACDNNSEMSILVLLRAYRLL